MMYDTGQAQLPGLESKVAVLPGKTEVHNRVVSENDSADGSFSTELSAARERFAGSTESEAVAPGRRQRPSEAADAPHTSANEADVANTAEQTTRLDAQDIDNGTRLNPSQQSLSAIAVPKGMPEQNSLAVQAEDNSAIRLKSGLEISDSVTNQQIDTGADTATRTDAQAHASTVANTATRTDTQAHASAVANADVVSNAGAVIRNDAGQSTDMNGLPASAQRVQESEPERLAGLLPDKDHSTLRGKSTVNLQPLTDADSSKSLGQLDSDHVSRTKADDTTFGPVRGSLESDVAKAGVILAGLNPTKTLSDNVRLHSERNPNGKAAANVALTESPVSAVSTLGQVIQLDAEGKALPPQTAASHLVDRNSPAASGNLSPHETAESAQVMATLKREVLMNDAAERNAVAMKTEAPKTGFNVEELLFQRSISAQQTTAVNSPVNSDPALYQSNSSANMFHTFGSGILTAPVTARGLPEAGMMMTAPTTVSLLSENAVNDIAGNIRWMKSEGLKSAVINVSPSGMGPISVKIGIEDETMNVSFVALQGATRDALDSALPRLRDQLLSQGNESVRVDVSDGKSGQNRSGAEGQFAENRQNQSGDNGGNGVGTRGQIYGEQTLEVDELTMIPSDKLPGEHSGQKVVRYDLYV